jgi:phenylalanyl-tRNA synthetase beta chain
MQQRLEVVGLRPINNVVDITNYVLMEACQPLHAFDYGKLGGGRIIVRTARAGEILTAIDGTKCKLTPEMMVIADASRPVAIAGVMGGIDTEVSGGTATVLLESAEFNGPSIRRTSRALGLPSESSYRFERGVDPEGVEWASRRAAALMAELAGGTVAQGVIDVWPGKGGKRRVTVRVPEIERILGAPVSAPRVKEILSNLQLGIVEADEQRVTVEVPSFRPDLEREIDLTEEVARVDGYGKIPTRTSMTVCSAGRSPRETMEDMVHAVLTARGFDEVLTVSFLPEDLAKQYSPWCSGPPLTTDSAMRKDENALRRSLIPHLHQVRKTNEDRTHLSVRVYEVAQVYLRESAQSPNYEKRVLGFLHSGEFGETKGVLETLAERLRLRTETAFLPCEVTFLEFGTSAVWKSGDTILGYLGNAPQPLIKRFDLRETPSVAEVDLDALLELTTFGKSFAELPRFPATDRDIAIVVDEGVAWEQILKTVRSTDVPHLRSVEFFDLYRGKSIGPGRKSIAFRMVFQSPERTLTNEEVNEHRDAIVAQLTEELAAKLR